MKREEMGKQNYRDANTMKTNRRHFSRLENEKEKQIVFNEKGEDKRATYKYYDRSLMVNDIEGTQVGSYIPQAIKNRRQAEIIINQNITNSQVLQPNNSHIHLPFNPTASQLLPTAHNEQQHYQQNYDRFYEGYTPDVTNRFRNKASNMLHLNLQHRQKADQQEVEKLQVMYKDKGFHKNINKYFGESFQTTANNSRFQDSAKQAMQKVEQQTQYSQQIQEQQDQLIQQQLQEQQQEINQQLKQQIKMPQSNFISKPDEINQVINNSSIRLEQIKEGHKKLLEDRKYLLNQNVNLQLKDLRDNYTSLNKNLF